MKRVFLYPTPELPDDTPLEHVHLSTRIRNALEFGGLKTKLATCEQTRHINGEPSPPCPHCSTSAEDWLGEDFQSAHGLRDASCTVSIRTMSGESAGSRAGLTANGHFSGSHHESKPANSNIYLRAWIRRS
jgi:hypothetical protein